MSAQENAALGRRIYEAFNKKDLDACLALAATQQVRGAKISVVVEAGQERPVGWPNGERFDDRGRVDDDHSRSRPERTAATISSWVAPPSRRLALNSTSAMGGRSAMREISPSR